MLVLKLPGRYLEHVFFQRNPVVIWNMLVLKGVVFLSLFGVIEKCYLSFEGIGLLSSMLDCMDAQGIVTQNITANPNCKLIVNHL